MKVLIAIALLSVASALPRPGVLNSVDFRPLIVPKEIIEAAQANNDAVIVKDAPDFTAKFVDHVAEEVVPSEQESPVIRTPVNFVDNVAQDADFAVKFVDNAANTVDEVPVASEGKVVDLPADEMHSVRIVDSPIEPSDDGLAVRFVDNAEELVAENPSEEDATAVRFVDVAEASPVESPIAVPNDGLAVKVVNEPLNEADIPQLAVHFVDAPFVPIATGIIIIGNVFEPLRPSELETVRVMDLPVANDGFRYPPKFYENPLLR